MLEEEMSENMKRIKITEMLIYIVGTELAGALSALLGGNSSLFYSQLSKPPLSPPVWVFPVIWSILYALMGISAFLIYTSNAPINHKRTAYIIYAVQLLVNFTWSIVFFRLKMLGVSVAVILLLLALIIVMIIVFRKIRPISAFLNVPYLLWTIFASYLNIGILILN